MYQEQCEVSVSLPPSLPRPHIVLLPSDHPSARLAVVAAQGMLHLLPPNASKADVLEWIENEMLGEDGGSGGNGGDDDDDYDEEDTSVIEID
jgi:hypothetical protein